MPGQRQIGGGKGSGGGLRTGSNVSKSGTKAKTNVTKIKNKKSMSPVEVKARVKVDRIKKSPAAEDVRKGNLNNLKKTFAKPKSKFGPIASGKATPKNPKK